MRGLLGVAALVLALGSGAGAADVNGPEQTVDAFHAALAMGDTKAVAALLTDKAVIFEEGGVERTKAEYSAHHLPADAAFAKVVRMSTARRFGDHGSGLAWVASEGRMTGTYRGKPVDRLITETMVLQETAAGWKIVHIHWSSAEAPKHAIPAD